MNKYNEDYDYDDYNDDDYNDKEIYEEKDKKNKKSKNKKSHKSKKIIRKSRAKKPKKKVVYKNKNNDNNSHSGCLTFLLMIVILALAIIIGYLIYVNYYNEENNYNKSNIKNEENEKICEANTTKYTLSSGLKKCSDANTFKLNVVSTDLSFNISRTYNEKAPYVINNVYYQDNEVYNTSITGINVSDDWNIKTDNNVIYLLIKNEDSSILTVIDNGKTIYSDNSKTEYKLSSNITYTKYTDLGLKEIDTCENYETNNQLDEVLWTKGKLLYGNGTISEDETEEVLAKDVCK